MSWYPTATLPNVLAKASIIPGLVEYYLKQDRCSLSVRTWAHHFLSRGQRSGWFRGKFSLRDLYIRMGWLPSLVPRPLERGLGTRLRLYFL